jgi:hypothetical protein
MRIAYVSREFGPITGGNIGTYIYNVTRSMAHYGYEVYLITDCFSNSTIHHLPANVILVPTKLKYPDRSYISSLHEYSERVYSTLKLLCQEVHLDAIEFAEYGAEGFITIRAKKLLNEWSSISTIRGERRSTHRY